MAVGKDDAHYEVVTAGQEVSHEQVPANGKVWNITYVEADAPSSSDGWIALIWDYGGANEEILFLTYASKSKSLDREIVGDGTKVLALILHNEGGTDLMMGGCYEAREIV